MQHVGESETAKLGYISGVLNCVLEWWFYY